MIVLVGLGNPGEKYARHRHNIGYMAVDAIAAANGFSAPREKFSASIREGFLDGPSGREKALIIKPLTFMNESGRAVRKIADFYKLGPDDFVVFYDELDLAPGKIRVKTGGGAAGHNGIRSIDAHLGNGFRRVRIGIGHPGDKARVTGHVLGNFSAGDQEWLEQALDAMAAAAPFLVSDDQRFATDVAQRTAQLRANGENSAKRAVQSKGPDQPDKKPASEKTQSESEKSKSGPFSMLDRLWRRDRD